MKKTTICYIENNGNWLMLYRNRKQGDMNEGKWISPGGKVEEGETPDECVVREVLEETGLRLRSWTFHGVIEFRSDEYDDEDMYLYSSSDFLLKPASMTLRNAERVNLSGCLTKRCLICRRGRETGPFLQSCLEERRRSA